MQTKFILPCLLSTLFFLNSFSPSAQNRKTIETTTDILMFITPVAGFAGSLAIGDYQGTKQIIFSGATNLAMTYALKYVIRKERPDHSDHHAFPSSHTSVSFQGASFIQRRLRRLGTDVCQKTRLVGYHRRSSHRNSQQLYLHPSVCPKTQHYFFTGNSQWTTPWVLCLYPVLIGFSVFLFRIIKNYLLYLSSL